MHFDIFTSQIANYKIALPTQDHKLIFEENAGDFEFVDLNSDRGNFLDKFDIEYVSCKGDEFKEIIPDKLRRLTYAAIEVDGKPNPLDYLGKYVQEHNPPNVAGYFGMAFDIVDRRPYLKPSGQMQQISRRGFIAVRVWDDFLIFLTVRLEEGSSRQQQTMNALLYGWASMSRCN